MVSRRTEILIQEYLEAERKGPESVKTNDLKWKLMAEPKTALPSMEQLADDMAIAAAIGKAARRHRSPSRRGKSGARSLFKDLNMGGPVLLQCDLCGKTCQSAGSMGQHRRHEHPGAPKFKLPKVKAAVVPVAHAPPAADNVGFGLAIEKLRSKANWHRERARQLDEAADLVAKE